MRNGKLTLSCAEAVEDETSLWKGKENEAVNLTSAPTSKSPESYSGLSNSCWTMPVSIHDSFPIRAVKQYPQYSSDLGGRGIRTLVAGQPLECLTDIVQYPLATPSRRCLRKIIVWRQMLLRAITAKYVGMECRSEKKARPKPCLTAWIFSAPLCLCGEPSRAPHPEMPATSANAKDAAACAMPSPRSGECARGSRQTTGPLLPACAPSRLPGQSAS